MTKEKTFLPILGAVVIYGLLSVLERTNPLGWTYPQMIILSIIVYCYLGTSQKIKVLSKKLNLEEEQ